MVYETVERNGPSGRSPVIQPANTLRSPTPPPPLSSHLPLGSVLHEVHEELTPNDRSFEVAGAFYTQKGNARDEQGWRRAPWLPRGSDGWAAALPHEPFPREGGVVDAEEEDQHTKRQSSKAKNSSGGPKRRTGAAGDGNNCMYSWWPSCSGVRNPQRQKQPSQKPAATPPSEAAAPSPSPGEGQRSAADGSPPQADSTASPYSPADSSNKPHDEGPKSEPSWWSYLSSFVV